MTRLLSTEYSGNRESMNIYLGETRLATRLAYEHDETTAYEEINTYYYHGDHLGSANIVSDFEGEKYEHLEYTPYGELWVEDTDAAYHTPFRFTSKEWDEETELYYYGARYMHPRNSTWISADPAGFELVNPMEQDENGKLVAKQSYSLIEGVNWYSYCSNNPVKYVDPTGKFVIAIPFLVIVETLVAATAGATAGVIIYEMFDMVKELINYSSPDNVNKSEGASSDEGEDKNKTPEEIAEADDSIPNKSGRGTKHKGINRPGNINDEFDEMVKPETVRDKGNGVRTGETPDGRKVIQYPESTSTGGSTIRVNDYKGDCQYKFRYPKE